jgi:hypothetical protein
MILVVFRHIHYLLHKIYSNNTETWTDVEILEFKWISLHHKVTKDYYEVKKNKPWFGAGCSKSGMARI